MPPLPPCNCIVTMARKAKAKHFKPKKRVREPRPNRGKKDATQPLTVDVSVSPSPSTSTSSLLSPSSTLVCTSGDESVLSQTISSTSETQRSGHIIPSDQDISDDIESDCTSSYVSESVSTADERSETPVSASATTEDVTLTEEEATDLIMELKTKVDLFLPCNWICVAEKRTVHLLLLSRNIEKSIQRRIGYRSDGELTVSVHGKAVDSDRFLKNLAKPGALCRNTVDSWVDFLVSLLNEVRGLEICSGIDFEDCVEAWDGFPNSYIDKNFFKESRYINTLRMNNCKLLVEPKCWRCVECSRAAPRVKRKMVSLKEDEFDIRTANIYLSTQQKLNKLKKQTQALNACKKKIERLQEKVQNLIEKEGVYVEDEMSNLMHSALKSSNLSPFQELFIQQQFKAASCKSARGMRWHPQMIRFALSIFLQSPSTYNILVDSKMMRLPHSRTLFDYSHCFEAEEGICNPVLESIHKHICEKAELKHKWHVLMCDEMHISKNIVYNRSTGELVGYTKITEVEKCLNEFQSYLDNTEVPEPDRASKMLSFMVKGVCNGVKEVVASYSVNRLSKEKLYSVTWNVIAYCERTGIQIIAFTSDGNASNRAFFKMNTPISPTKNGVVYDTINKAAPSRPLYFISDLPHLVKTIRNNFFNSRIKKGSKRCLTKNGEKILWSTIIRLFKAKKDKTLRKAYKLSAANVYLDSYSVMKVKYAFQVLSNTVSCDLQAQGWEKVSETVKFIKKVNDFADCLNGAHSLSGTRSANPLLNPYTDPNDSTNIMSNSTFQLSFDPESIGRCYEKTAHLMEVDVCFTNFMSSGLVSIDINLDYIKVETEENKWADQGTIVEEEHIAEDNTSCHQNEERNVDFTKVVKIEKGQAVQDVDVEEGEEEVTIGSTSNKKMQGQQMMLMRHPSEDFAVISDLYSLFEDYKTMACSSRSLICRQPPVYQALVKCVLCGDQFLGKADRLLKLCNHFESMHPSNAKELILGAIQKYDMSITHMRKALEFDKWFGTVNYKHVTRFLYKSV
ncbi:Transposable element P transposase [Frankliniella fusca]|uniref:Transposable element P transposase n=1 Tax=Frankliniella fusca TaxID=407009 RepID=A0AAE1H8X7_9NEOP|nr:Transposable element P transposase [Frankliniella fusca]KAK3917007.1 Transposable element P transposase [Frankliniella fusca]KAK3933044.1 Transposable element P transposase [Frankliniella fusca]